MAGVRACIQVAVVLVAVLAAAASPAPGLSSFLSGDRGAAGSTPSPGGVGSVFSDAITFPKQVVGSFLNRRQGAQGAEPAADHHPGHTAKPTTTSTKAATTPTTAATSTAAATTPSTTTTTTTTAATSTTAEPSPIADDAAESSESALSGRTSEQGASSSTANFTDAELAQCRQKWLEVTNSTVNQNLDILTVLLDYGGFPGQIGGIKWERNATEGQPDRWTYFYGDTDYKTYIRTERGEILASKAYPVRGATPDNISGDIYWSPSDFCGKLRHAKYTQWDAAECEAYDEPVSAATGRCYFPSFTNDTFKLCKAGTADASLLADSHIGTCESTSGNKGAVSYACLASLVCGR